MPFHYETEPGTGARSAQRPAPYAGIAGSDIPSGVDAQEWIIPEVDLPVPILNSAYTTSTETDIDLRAHGGTPTIEQSTSQNIKAAAGPPENGAIDLMAPARSAYTVKEGDSLSAIAAEHQLTVADLLALKGNEGFVTNPDLIRPGQKIIISTPASTATTRAGGTAPSDPGKGLPSGKFTPAPGSVSLGGTDPTPEGQGPGENPADDPDWMPPGDAPTPQPQNQPGGGFTPPDFGDILGDIGAAAAAAAEAIGDAAGDALSAIGDAGGATLAGLEDFITSDDAAEYAQGAAEFAGGAAGAVGGAVRTGVSDTWDALEGGADAVVDIARAIPSTVWLLIIALGLVLITGFQSGGLNVAASRR